MRLRGFLVAMLALLAAAPGRAETRYVRAGRFVDVEKGTVLADRLIRIVDGRIASVGPWTAAPTDGPVIDWSGFTVLPGLIDVHNHMIGEIQTDNVAEPLLHSEADDALIGVDHARAVLDAGFTTVRDVGPFRAFVDVSLKRAIEKRWVAGPRMAVAGAYITAPGGGGEVTGFAPDVKVPGTMQIGVVTSPDDVTNTTRRLFQGGADFIKLIATGAVLASGTDPGMPELSEAEMRAAVVEAGHHGSYAIAHAHGAEGIRLALEAGVRSIEHASYIDDADIALAKKTGAWIVMNPGLSDYITEFGTRYHWPEEILRKTRNAADAQRVNFGKCVRAGVKMAYGTDAGVFPLGQNARQFKYMVRWGMTPMQAIQSATVGAAALMMWSGDVGAVSPGHYADMIAVAADPLTDISALEHVDHVMKGGEVVR